MIRLLKHETIMGNQWGQEHLLEINLSEVKAAVLFALGVASAYLLVLAIVILSPLYLIAWPFMAFDAWMREFCTDEELAIHDHFFALETDLPDTFMVVSPDLTRFTPAQRQELMEALRKPSQGVIMPAKEKGGRHA